jgi:hypothetical protein
MAPAAAEAIEHPTEGAELQAAYRAEMDRMLRRRLRLTVALYLFLVGVGSILDARFHPERTSAVSVAYAAELLACALALAAAHLPRAPLGPGTVGALLGASLSVLLTAYNALAGSGVEPRRRCASSRGSSS